MSQTRPNETEKEQKRANKINKRTVIASLSGTHERNEAPLPRHLHIEH